MKRITILAGLAVAVFTAASFLTQQAAYAPADDGATPPDDHALDISGEGEG